jgi:hypothetical protein
MSFPLGVCNVGCRRLAICFAFDSAAAKVGYAATAFFFFFLWLCQCAHSRTGSKTAREPPGGWHWGTVFAVTSDERKKKGLTRFRQLFKNARNQEKQDPSRKK